MWLHSLLLHAQLHRSVFSHFFFDRWKQILSLMLREQLWSASFFESTLYLGRINHRVNSNANPCLVAMERYDTQGEWEKKEADKIVFARCFFLNVILFFSFITSSCPKKKTKTKHTQLELILFGLTLQDLSIAVPLTNGLTFLFTSVAGQCLGEHPASARNSIRFFLQYLELLCTCVSFFLYFSGFQPLKRWGIILAKFV